MTVKVTDVYGSTVQAEADENNNELENSANTKCNNEIHLHARDRSSHTGTKDDHTEGIRLQQLNNMWQSTGHVSRSNDNSTENSKNTMVTNRS